MHQAKLCDLHHIVGIIEDNGGRFDGLEFYLSTKVRNTFENTYMLSDDNLTLFVAERIGINKCQLHLYMASGKKGSLKESRDNFNSCIELLKALTNYSVVLTFVPCGNKPAKVSAKVGGFKYLGIIDNDSCKEEIFFYNINRES